MWTHNSLRLELGLRVPSQESLISRLHYSRLGVPQWCTHLHKYSHRGVIDHR